MREVKVEPLKLTDKEWSKREYDCWTFWHSMTERERYVLVRTVESEMQRLANTVSNWLPASATIKNGTVEIALILTVDEIGSMTGVERALTIREKEEAESVVADLSAMVRELEKDD